MPSRGFSPTRTRRYAPATAPAGEPRRSGTAVRRFTIVGDADGHALGALHYGLALIPRHVEWSSAARLDDPGRAIVAFVDHSAAAVEPLEAWAHRAWQPLTVVSLAARDDGAWRDILEAWCFRTMVGTESPDWIGLRRALEDVLVTDAWLVPLAADALGCHDAEIVHSLDVCLRLLPHRHTVTSWSRALGLEHRQTLHGLFAERNLPSPKCILDHLRLACIAYHGREDRPRPDRTELARQFGYSSADYLGKAVKRCLDCTVGELVAAGPGLAVDSLRCISRTTS